MTESKTTLAPAEGGLTSTDGVLRCGWCGRDPVYQAYHDEEWGVACRDETRLYEMLVLEGFQTGLSWLTILKKRPNFCEAFYGWEIARVARMTPAAQAKLLQNPGIIRNAGKIAAAVRNAQAYLRVQDEFAGFSAYLWNFTGGEVIRTRLRSWREVPAQSELSVRVAKDLKKRGFSYCGPVVVYSYLQAVGVLDDHIDGCWRATARR